MTNNTLEQKRTEISPGFYALGNNRLRKSDIGLWEMYIEGEPFSRGVSSGRLSSELITLQEDAFIAEIKRILTHFSNLDSLKKEELDMQLRDLANELGDFDFPK